MLDTRLISSRFSDILSLLRKFGFSEDEAMSYVVLSTKGSVRASELATLIGMGRSKAYRIIADLQQKGAVEIVSASPMIFRSVPLSSLASFLIMSSEQNLQSLRNESRSAIERFEKEMASYGTDSAALEFSFRIMRGVTPILSAISEMIASSGNSVKMILERRNLFRLASGSAIVYLSRKVEQGVRVSILAQQTESTEEIISGFGGKFSVRIDETESLPNMVVVDGRETFQFISDTRPPNSSGFKMEPSGFWCNSEVFASRIERMFDRLWENGHRETENRQYTEIS